MPTIQIADKPTLDSVKSNLDRNNRLVVGIENNNNIPLNPFEIVNSSAVVYKGEIHVLGSSSTTGYAKGWSHYKYNVKTCKWTRLLDLPYNFYQGVAVVFEGQIHIIGSGLAANNKNHYKWDDSEDSWSSVAALPGPCSRSMGVVQADRILIAGGAVGSTTYNTSYSYTRDSGWVTNTALSAKVYDGASVVSKGVPRLYTGTSIWDLRSNEKAWFIQRSSSCNFTASSIVYYGEMFYSFGGSTSGYSTKYYTSSDGYTWDLETDTLPYEFYNGCAVAVEGKIHLLGGAKDPYAHYVYDGETWSGRNSTSAAAGLSGRKVLDRYTYDLKTSTIIYCDTNNTDVYVHDLDSTTSISEITGGYRVDNGGLIDIFPKNKLGECYIIR